MAGIHGRAFGLVLQREGPEQTRATLGSFFVVAYSAAILALALTKSFGGRELALGIGLLPGVCAGWMLSSLIACWLSLEWLRYSVLAISGLTEVLLVLR